MVYSYQVIKFQSIILLQGTHWSQSISDKGVMYKSIHNPYSKIIVQTEGTKKLFHVPKDRTVATIGNTVHFLGELA
ncbi:MAG: hypothetical protein GWN01_08255 [Nitrosopumilaceae archaeon]|nr:hypothetical protein [Nitrosopumilaceae archaeon]NIU00911.1 hypothetical protein [Nitrosopumilaceae archaeon]NIU87364.1 hypothetical protein [Nitrosopumilaceae archaeon]NIV65892.1 hypothetical protein [Nitrosopumilaceae archaeon]NIX61513.1 hypothetical protein [Nitrosopumilaceae archaeon]